VTLFSNLSAPETALPVVWRRMVLWLTLAGGLLLGGCATTGVSTQRDPLEPFNRSVFAFNEKADALVLKPVATVYRDAVPSPVRVGVNNFFMNLGDAWSAMNSALQLRAQDTAENFMRFSVNTVFGFAGLLDIASELNIERHRSDFGMTLARWGVPAGPYLVLPLLGPSTVRDTAALRVDTLDLIGGLSDARSRVTLRSLRLIDTRSQLLRAQTMLDDVALDRYIFVRDVYLQRRGVVIKDESAPETEDPPAQPSPPAKP